MSYFRSLNWLPCKIRATPSDFIDIGDGMLPRSQAFEVLRGGYMSQGLSRCHPQTWLVEVCHQRQIQQVIYTSVTIARERVSTGNLPVTRHLVEICWDHCFLPGRPWEFSDGPLTQLCKCNGLPDFKIWTKMVEHNIPNFAEQTSKDSSIRAVHKIQYLHMATCSSCSLI